MNIAFENDPDFLRCDFEDVTHCEEYLRLLNEYIADPMGGGECLEGEKAVRLISQLREHSSVLVFFALHEGKYIGFMTTYFNYSTFKAKPMLYIHDVFVGNAGRGQGFGKKMIRKAIDTARLNGCCKLTLEVRHDNLSAQKIYADAGFCDTEPPMHYWEKQLL